MEACQKALDFALNEGGCRLYGTEASDMTLYRQNWEIMISGYLMCRERRIIIFRRTESSKKE